MTLHTAVQRHLLLIDPLCLQETEKRLKDIVHGNRKATGGANGMARKTALQQRAGNRLVVTVRPHLPESC